MEIVSVADPLPDAGETRSHGLVEVAVHVTVPAPLCVKRTVCAEVCEVNAPPVLAAAKRSDWVSSVMRGSGGGGGGTALENVAATLRALAIVNWQVSAVPLQSPVQPPNTEPVAGAAVSVTVV